MTDLGAIHARFEELKERNAARDVRMQQVAQIRGNNPESIAPGLFNGEWPKSVVSNFIDAAAHDLSEVIAPLPAINCNTSQVADDAARKRADKRTRIANYYVEASRVQTQMYAGADRYITYGFLPMRVEVNIKEQRPHISLDDPVGAYPDIDRFGNCVAYAKRWELPAARLAAMYPEYRKQIIGAGKGSIGGNTMLELVRWEDEHQSVLFIPERSGLVLASMRNPIGRCPVVIAQMPSFDMETRGQFDDVLWVQLARAKMAMLKLEAAQKAVEAPIALPQDVSHLAIGGDAIIRSATPEKIRRVELQVPSTIFAEDQALEREMRTGARYPEARTGGIDANIITGRGVQALMGGFDTQVKTAQTMFAQALQDTIALCFHTDEAVWGPVKKDIKGTENGQSFSLSYTPEKEIRGDHTVSVDYGLMAGLDPNRALVWGLQARSDKLISRQFLRKNLPVSLNSTLEEEMIDIEEGRDALKQAVAGYVQAIPVMAQQGQDPGVIVRSMSKLIQARRKGKTIEEAVEIAFEPEPPPEPEPSQAPPEEGGGPGDMGVRAQVPLGMDAATGGLRGVPNGQQGTPAGGRPDMRQMLAGLTSGGQANLTASVKRTRTI